ncbi:replication factor C 37 KD subunit [Reticulomyxa filosa]|uniref:Replication factor C 37 KD subunit n=1 Tax=Reticulomyxa filosa TaxID=46433 RepID=X6NYE0_RETFI|nr:replication factor C 37 KD subunit [Reticulomyxa filosa]|eukprot:ETO30996.1 replication factor C 37 KD subunit [Reticulomyxa filosa]
MFVKKVVVLNEVDKLSKDAQHGLRRTMEKYMKNCRLILQCESVSKLIEPLRSRCLPVRVPAPSHDQIVTVLHDVAGQEGVSLSDAFARQIALKSERNLRKALLMLQVASMESNDLVDKTPIKSTPWELFIEELARGVTEEQSPQRLMLARNKLYELLGNCIPPELIFKKLTIALMSSVDDSLRYDIVKWAAFHVCFIYFCFNKKNNGVDCVVTPNCLFVHILFFVEYTGTPNETRCKTYYAFGGFSGPFYGNL